MQKLLIVILLFCSRISVATSQVLTPSFLGSKGLLTKLDTQLNSRKDSLLYTSNTITRKIGELNLADGVVSKVAVNPNKSIANSVKNATADTIPDHILVPIYKRCKAVEMVSISLTRFKMKIPFVKDTVRDIAQMLIPVKKVPFLQFHGNVMYNLNYYSRIDTPYNESNIYQHTIQTYLDILVAGKYPFRIFLTNRFSNSSLFKNYSDYNFSYTSNSFSQSIKDQIRKQFLQSVIANKFLDSFQNQLNKKLQKLRSLEGWIKNPALIQKIVEAREISMLKPSAKTDTVSNGPGSFGTDSLYASKQKEADSLRREISSLQQLLRTTTQKSQADLTHTLQEIQKTDDPQKLRQEMQSLGMSDSSLPKGYKTLMALKSFSIGRTVVNYSELSAKNISINGVQTEYNPSSVYYALACGSVDYRFRDFIVQGPIQAHQNLNVLRYGRKLRDDNSIVLTFFQGHRQLYNAGTTDSSNVHIPSSTLMGMTLEGNYHITDHIMLSAEVGKSSIPSYSHDSTAKSNSLTSQLFQMNNRSNEAWSIKINGFFPATQTRIRGSYKQLGVNYQSFSIFTDGSSQRSWSASIDQLFFRRQLDIVLSANTNDFTNPFINQTYKSTTVFESVQATLRKRNWPVLSLGYFPSSQVTKLGNGQYLENLFYTLVGNVSHSYSFRYTLMNTALAYTEFYNRPADSGFVYFNTKNLLLTQSVFLGRFTIQANLSMATNQSYQLYTMEGKLQFIVSKILGVGAGIKYDHQTVYDIEQVGYSAETTFHIPQFGQVQFSADKGFMPGMNNRLVPDNRGRLSYFKTF